MTDYVLVGGGALAREILDWFAPGFQGSGSGFVGYLDDGDDPMAAFGSRLAQLGTIKDHKPKPGQALVMGIGSPAGKAAVSERLKGTGATFATLIHPTAWVSASARIDAGAVLGLHAHASADAHVGEFVQVGAFSSVGHDASVGPCCTLSSYVDLTGWVKSGRTCLFGSGARVLPKVTIGDSCIVGAGAVVVRNVKSETTVYAQPARSL
jgi:sugar O-acyltransferase (sialic acid O-acetyltransferase NeuD family)